MRKHMCFSPRGEWRRSWRLARIIWHLGITEHDALCKLDGLDWLAICRLRSREAVDPILATPWQNQFATRIVNEILEEESHES